jgi:hypothetical protein
MYNRFIGNDFAVLILRSCCAGDLFILVFFVLRRFRIYCGFFEITTDGVFLKENAS